MRYYLITLVLLLAFTITLNAQTQLGQNITGLNAHESFGRSVCISDDGKTMAANLGQDKQTGGQIRVYRYSNGSWNQLGNTIIGNSQDTILAWDRSLAISASGNRIVSYNLDGKDSVGVKKGHVKVYEYDDINGWNQIGQTLYGNMENEYFGASADISADGNRIIVSTRNKIIAYDYNGNLWQQVGDTIFAKHACDHFYCIALSDDKNYIATGSPHGFNGTTCFGVGEVRVYNLNGNAWTQVGQTFNGAFNNNGLGISVRLSQDGKVLAIGDAPENASPSQIGSVTIYDLVNNNWIQKGNKLTGVATNDNFGWEIDMTSDGNRIAVGAFGANFVAGYVKLYDFNNGTWSQTGNTIHGDSVNYHTGATVSLSRDGQYLGVGSAWAGINGPNSGLARVYNNLYPLALTAPLANKKNWSIYPNPSKELFTISINCNKAHEIKLRLRDMSGKTVWRQNKKCEFGENSFNFSSKRISNGNYFLTINGAELNDTKLITIK